MRQLLISAYVVLAFAVAANYAWRPVEVRADLNLVDSVNPPIAVFRCTPGSHDHMFYLYNIITWSKIGRDGKEHYLSINWNLQKEAKEAGYELVSQYYWDNSTASSGAYKLYFVLSRGALTPEDEGEYICRIHSLERTLLGEQRILTSVLENGLTISPYQVETDLKLDVAVNCLYNATNQPTTNEVTVSHVNQAGTKTKVSTNGKLVSPILATKYDVKSIMATDGTVKNIITVKDPKLEDNGYIVCETINNNVVKATKQAKLIIGRPKLEVTPMFYLQMPEDSIATFKCHCDVMNAGHASHHHSLSWSLNSSITGAREFIYKDGKLLGDPTLYSISTTNHGMTVTLHINGLRQNETEGDYICSMHKSLSTEEITTATVPTSVNAIDVKISVLMNEFPTKVRFACVVLGAHWDSHYLDTHTLEWKYAGQGVSYKVSENAKLIPKIDRNKYGITFNETGEFSVLDINTIEKSNHGQYECTLLRNSDRTVLGKDIVAMDSTGNTTRVG